MTHADLTDQDAASDQQSAPTAWAPADLKPRFQAAGLDAIAAWLVGLLPVLIAVLLANGVGVDTDRPEISRGIIALTIWGTTTAFLALTQAARDSTHGQTPGKGRSDLRVVTASDGSPLSRSRLLARSATMALILPFGYPLAALVGLVAGGILEAPGNAGAIFWLAAGLNLLAAATSPSRQSLVDRLAGTAVVQAHRRTHHDAAIEPTSTSRAGLIAAMAITGLSLLWLLTS